MTDKPKVKLAQPPAPAGKDAPARPKGKGKGKEYINCRGNSRFSFVLNGIPSVSSRDKIYILRDASLTISLPAEFERVKDGDAIRLQSQVNRARFLTLGGMFEELNSVSLYDKDARVKFPPPPAPAPVNDAPAPYNAPELMQINAYARGGMVARAFHTTEGWKLDYKIPPPKNSVKEAPADGIHPLSTGKTTGLRNDIANLREFLMGLYTIKDAPAPRPRVANEVRALREEFESKEHARIRKLSKMGMTPQEISEVMEYALENVEAILASPAPAPKGKES